jgi:hypothetical protein
MPPPEDEQWLKDLEQQFRDLPDARIEQEIERWRPGTAPREVLLGILAERRLAAGEPEKERFEQSYEQTERHHSQSRRQSRRAEVVAWAALAVSIISIILQQCSHAPHMPQRPN